MSGWFWFALGVVVGATGLVGLATLRMAINQAGFDDEP